MTSKGMNVYLVANFRGEGDMGGWGYSLIVFGLWHHTIQCSTRQLYIATSYSASLSNFYGLCPSYMYGIMVSYPRLQRIITSAFCVRGLIVFKLMGILNDRVMLMKLSNSSA